MKQTFKLHFITNQSKHKASETNRPALSYICEIQAFKLLKNVVFYKVTVLQSRAHGICKYT